MIPNLVEIVKGYAKHEQETLQKVTEMRTKAMGATSFDEKAKLEDQLSNMISKDFCSCRKLSELKANTNFLGLQTNLKDLEDNIQKSRRYYNGAVRDFNNMIVFPNKYYSSSTWIQS